MTVFIYLHFYYSNFLGKKYFTDSNSALRWLAESGYGEVCKLT